MGFFFNFFWGWVGGGFRAVQAPFWENPGVKCKFRARWTRKTAAKNKFSRSCLFSVCVFMCVYVCVCVFVIEYVVCVHFSRKRPRRVLSRKALSLNIVIKHSRKFC